MRLVCMLMVLIPLGVQAEEILLGAGARNRPVFDGSGDQTTDLIPVVRYYGRPWFARTTQGILEGGIRGTLAQGFAVGMQLAYEQGPLDKDPGASLGVHLEWDGRLGPAPITLLGRLRDYLDAGRGTQ